MVFGLILVAALSAFELFNFATTEYALATLIGGIEVLGVNWSSVLAIAFCAIDFAGLARLFTPERGRDEPKEVWYLLGAWFLGASMNAVMTWWAVTNALIGRPLGNEIVTRDQLLTIVPIFVAVLVWLTRILIIGTFGVAGDRIFSVGTRTPAVSRSQTSRGRWLPGTNARPSNASVRSASSNYQRQRSTGRSYEPPRQSSPPPIDDEELVYEDVDQPNPSNANRSRSYGYTRPAPKPGSQGSSRYGYSYSTRAYGSQQPSYITRAGANPGQFTPNENASPNENERFYR
jgi:hypothetical protein